MAVYALLALLALCAGQTTPPPLVLAKVFDYTGSYLFFTVPPTVTVVQIHIWGGGGGGGNGISATAFGGAGAFINGSLFVSPLETLRVIVGCGACAASTDSTGGGGRSTYGPFYPPYLANGGGCSAVQRCTNSSGCAEFASVSSVSTTAWAELVTAGGGGAGNFVAGGFASWNLASPRGGGDCMRTTNPSAGCAGGGGSLTAPGRGPLALTGSRFQGGTDSVGGGGGFYGGAGGGNNAGGGCGGLWGGGGGSSNPFNLTNATGSDPACATGWKPAGQQSPYFSLNVSSGVSLQTAANPGRVVFVFSCASGYFGNVTVPTCVLCPAGSFCPAGAASAAPCPAGSFSADGAASPANCTSCPAGTFAPTAGSASCRQCARGHYCPAGTSSWASLNCGRGSYCPEGSDAPTPCPVQVPPPGGWGALQAQGPAFLVETARCLNQCFWNFTSGDGFLSRC